MRAVIMLVLRILCVLMVLVVPARATRSVLIEPVDHRALRELRMEVVESDLKDVSRMQAALIKGFAALGIDYEVEGAIMLWCPRTRRVFFAHPSGDLERRTRRLLRAAVVMAAVA